jgi:large subunit ribosomal protein L15
MYPFIEECLNLLDYKSDKVEATVINLDILEKNFKDGEKVSIDTLKKKALIAQKAVKVKILGDGKLTKKISVEGIPTLRVLKRKILKAGGVIKIT